ncbi:MAG: hypothetical protein AAF570_01595, partial [Bacteroidota bacterium]
FSFILALSATMLFVACKPDPGPGGEAVINGVAKHHDDEIPNTKVYIKYGTLESPGLDPGVYDDSTTAGADARFQFSGLERGEYYVYGIGYDAAIDTTVRAGVPVNIEEAGEVIEILLPVTEGD